MDDVRGNLERDRGLRIAAYKGNKKKRRKSRVSTPTDQSVDMIGPTTMISSEELDDPMVMPLAVQEKLNNLEDNKAARKRFEVSTHLDDIHFRVRQALAHAGVNTDIHPSLSDEDIDCVSINRPPGFYDKDEELKREERAYQRSVLDMIRTCMQGCSTQQFMLGEICDWLDSHDNLLTYTVSEEELEQRQEEAKQSVADIKEALGYASRVVGKIRALGYVLMKEAGFFPDTSKEKDKMSTSTEDTDHGSESDNLDDQMAEEMNAILKSLPPANKKDSAEPMKIYEESTLLEDPVLLQTAIANVNKGVQKAVRAVTHNHDKQVLRDVLKQYKHITKVIEIQQEDVKQKSSEITKLTMENEEVQNGITVWKEEYEKSDLHSVGLQRKVDKLQSALEELEHSKEELQLEMEEMRQELEQQIAEMAERRISVVTFSSHNSVVKEASFGSRSLLRATESAINAATKKLEDEIEELKQTLEEREKVIHKLEKEISAEKEEREKLEARLELNAAISKHETVTTVEKVVIDTEFKKEMLKKIKGLIDEKESVGRQLGRIKTELNHKVELIQYQERCIKDLKDELGQIDVDEFLKGNTKLQDGSTPDAEVKRMVQRMQKDFRNEINRHKSYIEKEKTRHEASVRKQDNVHKEQLMNTHKQSLHILRALNRFKDAVANIMDREGLHVGANDIRRLDSLSEDEKSGDTKMLLAQMSGNAVDLLVTIELKLSQALMNKRLEIKDNNIARKFATKDLEVQSELAHKAKQAAELLAEKLREVTAKLSMAESTLDELRKVEDERHRGISDRYRKLMKQYMDMQSGVDKLQKKYRKTVKYKDRAMKTVVASKDNIARLMKDQQTYISNIEEHVKKSREEHRHQLALSINDQKRNLKMLDQALKENKITRETHALTADIIRKTMELPMLKLRNLFLRYIAYRKYKDEKEKFAEQCKHALLITNIKDVRAMHHHFEQRFEKTNMQWQAKSDVLDHRHKDLFVEMDSLFNFIIAETGMLLIQPDPRLRVKFRPPKPPAPTETSGAKTATKSGADTLSGSDKASSDYSKQATTSKAPSQPAHRGSIISENMDLIGQKLSLQPTKEEMWHLPPISTDTKITAVEVPHIVDIEVNQIMRAAKLALHRAGQYKRTYPMAQAEVFDYANPEAIVPIHKSVPNRGHRCYGNRSLFSSDLDGLTDSSTEGTLEMNTREKRVVTPADAE